MTHRLIARNQRAMRAAQELHDLSTPPAVHIPRDERIEAEVGKLLSGVDAEQVAFQYNPEKPLHPAFLVDVSEALNMLCSEDPGAPDIRLILAVLAGDYALARSIAERTFRQPVETIAYHLIDKAAKGAK